MGSEHRETPAERLDRLTRSCPLDSQTVPLSVDDFRFLLAKANLTMLVAEENKALRWQLEEGWLGQLRQHIRFLEAENKYYKEENQTLKKQK